MYIYNILYLIVKFNKIIIKLDGYKRVKSLKCKPYKYYLKMLRNVKLFRIKTYNSLKKPFTKKLTMYKVFIGLLSTGLKE